MYSGTVKPWRESRNRIVPVRRVAAYFEMSLLEWYFTNLGDEVERDSCPWSTTFAAAVW